MPTPQLSGQVTVATPGTAVQLPNVPCRCVHVAPLHTNTTDIYIGNDGADDVTTSNGFGMAPAEEGIDLYPPNGNLSDYWLDTSTASDGISWIVVDAGWKQKPRSKS